MNKEQKRREKKGKMNLIKMNKIIAFLFIIILFGTSCRGPTTPTPEPTYTLRIEGIITDANTNSPIAGAKAQLYGRTGTTWQWDVEFLAEAITDSNGYYYIECVRPGTLGANCYPFKFAMVAFAEDYYDFIPKIRFDESEFFLKCTESLQTINIQLEPKS